MLVLTTFDLDEYVYRRAARRRQRLPAQGHPARPSCSRRSGRWLPATSLLAPAVTRRLIERFAPASGVRPRQVPRGGAAEPSASTTSLVLVARGLSNAEIAAELVVSEATVKTHVAHVLAKLGLRDRVQVVVRAYETGLVEPGDNPET